VQKGRFQRVGAAFNKQTTIVENIFQQNLDELGIMM
jgi:hypothetical protein